MRISGYVKIVGILSVAVFLASQYSNTPATFKSSTEQNKSNFIVSRVIDGDTVELSNGERIRYIGIDTPETVDPRKPIACFGKESSDKNKELVLGRTIYLEKDLENKDKYGRLLRYVWLIDTQATSSVSESVNFVNLELVREGYARVYTFPPNVRYYDQFLKAEKEAREMKRGLWGKCLGT